MTRYPRPSRISFVRVAHAKGATATEAVRLLGLFLQVSAHFLFELVHTELRMRLRLAMRKSEPRWSRRIGETRPWTTSRGESHG
mgnify:CR=1 FL=1